jgi:hypothetical protein
MWCTRLTNTVRFVSVGVFLKQQQANGAVRGARSTCLTTGLTSAFGRDLVYSNGKKTSKNKQGHVTSRLFASHLTTRLFAPRHGYFHVISCHGCSRHLKSKLPCAAGMVRSTKILHKTHTPGTLKSPTGCFFAMARRSARRAPAREAAHLRTDVTDATNPDGVDGSANKCTGTNVAAGIAVSWCTRPRRLEPSGSAAITGSYAIFVSGGGVTFEWRHQLWHWGGGSRVAVAAAGTAATNALSLAAATAVGRRTSGSADRISSSGSSRGFALFNCG